MLAPIDVQGPATVGSVVWRLGPQLHITIIVKASVGYDEEGHIRAVDACPIGERDLAPFLRGSQIICDGCEGQASLTVARSGDVVLAREVEDGAALGAIAAEQDLALFGDSVPTLEPSVDAHRFSSAPPEQRVADLQGNERFSVAGVEVTLPPIDVKVSAKTGTFDVPFATRLDTLLLTPSDQRFAMLWRGDFPVAVDAVPALRLDVALTTSQQIKGVHTNTETGTVKLGGFIARSEG